MPGGNGKITRRKAIKTLGVSGLGLLGVSGSTVRAEDSVLIPKYRKNGEVIKWKRVPRAWYKRKEHVNHVAEMVIERYLSAGSVPRLNIVAGDSYVTPSYRSPEIEVEIASESISTSAVHSIEETIPSEIQDVPIRTTEAYNPKEMKTMSGGSQVSTFDGKSGTLGWTADYGSKTGMVTARHTFTQGSGSNVGCAASLYTNAAYDQGTKFGKVNQDWQRYDAAWIEFTNSSYNPGNSVLQQSGEMSGIVDKPTLEAYRDSNSNVVSKFGQATGKATNGEVESLTHEVSCVDYDTNNIKQLVKVSNPMAPGDSGGPQYIADYSPELNKTFLYFVGLATHSASDGKAMGTGGYRLENKTNLVLK